ncbi:MAG: 50S ribosomal protein L11 methyltransferase [Pseudorhodoplanes sp.]
MTDPEAQRETLLARVVTDRAGSQLLADRLSEELDPATCAVSNYEQGDDWVAEAVFTGGETRAQIERLIRAVFPQAALTVTSVTERDWVARSLEGLAPVVAGRFVIHGAHDRGRVGASKIGIEIEAALAFGTGHHGTTRGCLLAFETIARRARHARSWRILDIGTGTGVLAIAAARALHAPVLASDIDPVAVSVARGNAKLNRAGALLRGFTAAGAHGGRFRAGGPYDLIFANILEAPLRRLSQPLSALLAPGGRIILSGLLSAQANSVLAAYRRQGLKLEARLPLDGWMTLTMRR